MELSVHALQRGKEAGRVGGHELFSSSATLSPGFPSSTPPALIPKDPQRAYSTARPAPHTVYIHWCIHSTAGKDHIGTSDAEVIVENLSAENANAKASAFPVTVTTWRKLHPRFNP